MEYKFRLSKIHCAGCALALEQNLNAISGVKAEISFVTKTLKLFIDTETPAETLTEVKIAITKFDHSIEILDFDADENIEKKEKLQRQIDISRFSLSVIFLVIGLVLNVKWLKITIFAISYIISAYNVIWGAILNIKGKNIFDEKLLMTIASIGAFVIGEYVEAICVMVLYGIGQIFENVAVDKSKNRVQALLKIKQPYANVYDGESDRQVELKYVGVGALIHVKPGERVPLDGVVVDGTSYLDVSAITGESREKIVTAGDEVLSGSINGSSLLLVKVTKLEKDSTVSKIIDMVQNATETKAKTEKFISKFSKIYTPAVIICAFVLAFVPPIFFGFSTFSVYAYRALCFLVVSCPCALVISVPLTYFAGIGSLARSGVLVKGASFVETLASADSVIFDKTGTLTTGVFEISEIYAAKEHNEDEILEIAAYAENFSNHKIAKSIKKLYNEKHPDKPINLAWINGYNETAGLGIEANIFGADTLVGNAELLKKHQINFADVQKAGTVLHVACGDEYYGYIVICDEIKKDAKQAITELKKMQINVAMCTGDEKNSANLVADKIGIDEVYAGLLPEGKVNIIKSQVDGGKKVAFVGDGINDAPSIASSNVGISMGGFGTDASIEASDVVLMTDEPSHVALAIKKAKKTQRIAKQNIFGSIAIKLAILTLIGFGFSGMWLAVFADVGVSLLAVLNGLRAMLK